MNQLKAGAVLNYLIIVVNLFVGLVYTPYMLKMMGQKEYGLYSLVASIIAYITVFDVGLGNAVIRYISKYRALRDIKSIRRLIGTSIIIYCAIGGVILLLGILFYFYLDELFAHTLGEEDIPRLQIMFIILIANLVISLPMSVFGSIINAYERFVFPRTINLLVIILNTFVMVVLLHMGYKAISMVVVQSILNISTLFLNFFYVKYKIKIVPSYHLIDKSILREFIIYSIWIFVSAIIDRLYWSTGQFVLGATVSAVSVSVYALAIHLESMYMTLSTAITSVFLPKVTSIVVRDSSNNEINSLFMKTGRIQNCIISTILFFFVVLGSDFILLWAGVEYHDTYIITILFYISLYPPLIQTLGITILQARNKIKFRSQVYLAIALISLVLQIVVAPYYGGIGCAAIVALALLMGQGVIMNWYYYSKQNIDIVSFWKAIIKMDIIPICLGVIYYVLCGGVKIHDWYDFALHVFILSLIYFPIQYVFNLNNYEKQLIRSFFVWKSTLRLKS